VGIYELTLPFDDCILRIESCARGPSAGNGIKRPVNTTSNCRCDRPARERGGEGGRYARTGYRILRSRQRETHRLKGKDELTEDGRSGPRFEGKDGHMDVTPSKDEKP